MFYKNLANVSPARNLPQPSTCLHLVADRRARTPFVSAALVSSPDTSQAGSENRHHLLLLTARRVSSFCAEAAVLVLVFGILDLLIVKGHVAGLWILSALGVSLGLLALSVATDFGAHRWIKAHP